MISIIILSIVVGITSADEFEVITEINEEICIPPRMCVPHYQCFQNGTYNQNGAYILRPRYHNQFIAKEHDQEIEESDAPPNTTNNSTGPVVCSVLERCCDYDSVQYKGCGYKSKQNNELPWIVTLVEKNPIQIQFEFLCSGSLIHRHVVLTAAHCVDRIRYMDYKVRTADTPSQEQNINEIVIHNYYDSRYLYHDIAMVFVDAPFVLNAEVQPICLAKANIYSHGEMMCYATTWYTEQIVGAVMIETITSMEVDLVSSDICQNVLQRSQLGYRFQLYYSFMCATSFKERDTCSADEGLPLICPIADDNSRYYQSGIVSWGIDEQAGDFPDLYTDVAKHRSWIDQQMMRHNYGTDSYSY